MQIPKFGDHRLFIYDFETSGFWNNNAVKIKGIPIHQPIQVAIIVRELDGTHHYYDSYIKYGRKLSDDVKRVTGITDEILAREGKPIEEVFAEINKRLTVPDTLIVGHNTLEFDNKFMDYYLQKFGYDPVQHYWCYDTLGQFKGHLTQRKKGGNETYETYHWDLMFKGGNTVNSSLEDLCSYYGVPTNDDLHNAVPDTEYTYEVFKEQFKDPMNLLPIKRNGLLTHKNIQFVEKVMRGSYKYTPRKSWKR